MKPKQNTGGSAFPSLTPEQKLRRNIKFALDRTPSASGPEGIAVLIEVTASVLNVMRKALVSLGAPESVMDAHDDGDGDVVEQWIEGQPRRVPLAEGQQDTSKQDAEDYRREQEAAESELAALRAENARQAAEHIASIEAIAKAGDEWKKEQIAKYNQRHAFLVGRVAELEAAIAAKDAALAQMRWAVAYAARATCSPADKEAFEQVLSSTPATGWLSPEEAAKLREERDMAIRDREYVIKCKDELTRDLATAREDSADLDWLCSHGWYAMSGELAMVDLDRTAIRAARNAGGAHV